MIEAYWDEMFGEFKTESEAFVIPDFPEALMSPHFGVKNIVGGIPSPIKLCYFDAIGALKPSTVQSESLENAVDNSSLWAFIEENNPEAFPFIKRLLPFLLSTSKRYHHFYFSDEKGIAASAIVGVSSESAFIFNVIVRVDLRKKGLFNGLVREIQFAFAEISTFYWTLHPWLTKGSTHVVDYHIVYK
jgi:hypothetical protein